MAAQVQEIDCLIIVQLENKRKAEENFFTAWALNFPIPNLIIVVLIHEVSVKKGFLHV